MKISLIDEKYKEEAIEIWNYCFDIPERRMNRLWENQLKDKNCLAAFEGENMTACLAIKPFKIHFNQTKVKMGGIGLVGTLPEYRHSNYASKTLLRSLEIMREREQIISILGPFSAAYYRKYGWEIAYQMQEYHLKMENVKGLGIGQGIIKALAEKDINDLIKTYYQFASSYNGSLVRNKNYWQEKFIKDKLIKSKDLYLYGYYNDQGVLEGFLDYYLEDNIFQIRELITVSLEAKKELLNFIYKHRAQVDQIRGYFPPDDRTMLILKKIKGSKNFKIPGKMARVVDVKKVLKKMTYDSNIKIDYKIKVEDPWAEWNNNVFSVAIANGKTKVDAGAKRADIVCDIGTFSQISLGFISLEEARPMGKITINDLNKFKAIKKLFKSKNTFIIDNF